jgi:hypothetical protein
VNLNLQTNFSTSTYLNGVRWKIAEDAQTDSQTVQSIIVYDGSSWTTSPQWVFEYAPNSDGSNYGDLTKITLPTGGTISYTWATVSPCGAVI